MQSKYTLAEIKHTSERISMLHSWDNGLTLIVLCLSAIILIGLQINNFITGVSYLVWITGVFAIICLFLKLEVYLEKKKYESIITIMKKI